MDDDYPPLHALMGELRLRPYAIFPGPDASTWAVYLQPPVGPRFLLVRLDTVLWREWWWQPRSHDANASERLVAEVASFGIEAAALAQRTGLPTAMVWLVRGIHAPGTKLCYASWPNRPASPSPCPA